MKISVAMCTYNGEKYIQEQLESILQQSHQVDEIMIVDDISQDHTVEKIKDTLKDSNVEWKLVVNDKKLGVTKNFEKAISLCSGDIIFLSDQDDRWKENKVEKMIASFDTETLAVFTNARLIDGNGQDKNQNLWNTVEFYPSLDEDQLFKDLIRVSLVTGATMAFKKDLFQQAYPFDPLWIHDEWLALHAILLGKIKPIDENLIEYRIHDHNTIGVDEFTNEFKKNKYNQNLSKAKALRLLKYKRYLALSNSIKQDNERIQVLRKCVDFWKKINDHENFFILTKCLLSGEYKQFSSGIPAYLRDLNSLRK